MKEGLRLRLRLKLIGATKDEDDKNSLDLGANRFEFLEDFPRVQGQMELYVQMCATRLSVMAEIPYLLPANQLLKLPYNKDFFLRLFSDTSRVDQIMAIIQEARRFDSNMVSQAIGKATGIVSRVSRAIDLEQQGTLMKLLSYLFLALLLITPSPGPNYKLIRNNLLSQQAHLLHNQLLQDLLSLIIDFDKQVEHLLRLERAKKHIDRTAKIAKQRKVVSEMKTILIESCEVLEEQMLEAKYPTTSINEALLNTAFAIQAQNNKTEAEEEDREAMRRAVQEVNNPAASFHEKLARVRVDESNQDLTELAVDEEVEKTVSLK